jgi:hypothetical protein
MSALSADQMYKLADARRASISCGLLQDAAIRQGGWDRRPRPVRDPRQAHREGRRRGESPPPGRAFGTLETKVVEKTNGTRRARVLRLQIEITFLPDTTVVDADEIAFVQTVRASSHTATGATRIGADQQEPDGRRRDHIDRLGGASRVVRAMTDAGGGGATLKRGRRRRADGSGVMLTAEWERPNTTWDSETSVICKAGADAGRSTRP